MADFKPSLLPKSTIDLLQKESSRDFKVMEQTAKRIGKRLKLGSKERPISMTRFVTSVDSLRKSGIGLLLDAGMGEEPAKYVMEILNAKESSNSSGRRHRESKRRLGFQVPNGPFMMTCTTFPDSTCGCDVSWPGGGMSISCF
jgi:hypothetical protein